jgi:hypothetical protein
MPKSILAVLMLAAMFAIMLAGSAAQAGTSPASSRPVLAHGGPHTAPRAWSGSAINPGPDLVAAMQQHLGRNPTGWSRNWCGHYLGLIARGLGLKPPAGAALAANWRHFGMPAHGPAPGVVAVFAHHVGVVVAVLPGSRVLVRSGNHGHRVADGVYAAGRAIAWRKPA